MLSEDQEMVENMIIDHGMDVKPEPYTASPGKKGLDMSHAGGEFKGLTQEIAGISGWWVLFFHYLCYLNHTWFGAAM